MAADKISQRAGPHIKGFPACCVCTKTADAARNEDILYNLVLPVDGELTSVRSADGIVNVIPPNRVYTFDSVESLDVFRLEMLKRPSVLHFTVTYVGCPLLERLHPDLSCGAVRDTENWILMMHQLHPKILGRLQMGFDHARSLLFKQTPFFLHFNFNEALARHFSNIFMWYESNSEYRQLKIKIHGADIVIQHGSLTSMAGLTQESVFEFEDLTMHDFAVRRPADAVKILGASAQPVRPDSHNLKQQLPGWEFSLDENNALNTAIRSRYSYASASAMISKMFAVSSSIEEESAI